MPKRAAAVRFFVFDRLRRYGRWPAESRGCPVLSGPAKNGWDRAPGLGRCRCRPGPGVTQAGSTIITPSISRCRRRSSSVATAPTSPRYVTSYGAKNNRPSGIYERLSVCFMTIHNDGESASRQPHNKHPTRRDARLPARPPARHFARRRHCHIVHPSLSIFCHVVV